MGDIRVKFTANRRKHRYVGKALVDSGAQTSVFGIDVACKLGVDLAKAPKVERETVGGLILDGLQLGSVKIVANGRKATLHDVFVPVAQVTEIKNKKGVVTRITTPVPRDEETLLGQDFLQASKSMLDFSDDTLKGIKELGPSRSISRKFTTRPAGKAAREIIRALVSCPIPKSPAKR